jgi:TonB family protein
MAESTDTAGARANDSAGHLSVHFEGAHPAALPFMFEQRQSRMGGAAIGSFVWHVAFFVGLIFLVRYKPTTTAIAAVLPPPPNNNIVWLSEPGPGGGGGGGGNRMKEPPRQAEMPGKDKITVPVEKPPKLEMQEAKKEPDPVAQLNIPAKSLAAAQDSLPGAIEAPPGPPTLSQGSGSGGGSGTGNGTGSGPGTGSGLGPGSGGGTGGGVYQPGNGVTNPVPTATPKPAYTSDAMRAKIQGVAMVVCIVEKTGQPSECHISRSLDSTFGLDAQAVDAAQRWRFRPGMLKGEPVRVEIMIEMQFTLR